MNGVEVGRLNLPKGNITHTTLATVRVDGAPELVNNEILVLDANIARGENTLAVEVCWTGVRPVDGDVGVTLSCV
jgi:hypothetical protein